MPGGLLQRIHKERFLALPLGEIFKGEINPFYTIKLGNRTYYYFIILDFLNEVLLSLSVTSPNMLKEIEGIVKAEEITLLRGMYALTYRDRILTCGSLKPIRLKENNLMYMDDAVKFAFRAITGPTLYSWLALFPPYIIPRDNSTPYFYSENSRITATPEGHSCYGGLLIGSAYSRFGKLNEEAGELPFIEYYPGVEAKIKYIACRPEPLGSDKPVQCRSFNHEVLVKKQLVSQLGFSYQGSPSGLLFLVWCPRLHVEKPVLVGLKPLSSEETMHFIFGKALLLSSLDNIDGQKVVRVWISEKRLKEVYDWLLFELKSKLGFRPSPHLRYEHVVNNHVRRDLIFKSQKKGVLPITMGFYLRCLNFFKLDNFAKTTFLETQCTKENEEVIYLERDSIKQFSDSSSRALLLSPMANDRRLMII